MVVSEVFILSSNFKVLARKIYRPDVAVDAVQEFISSQTNADGNCGDPVFKSMGVTFFHLHKQQLYLVAVVNRDVCHVTIMDLLSKIYQLCKDFCGKMDEETVKLNYILIKEILDEVLDYGYIQELYAEKITPLIFSEAATVKSQENLVPGLFGIERKTVDSADKPITAASNLDKNVNAIYADVIEKMTVVFDKNNVVSRCHVNGELDIKVFLNSGSQILLAFNSSLILKEGDDVKGYGQNIFLEDYKFHSCVNHERLKEDKSLTFSAPVEKFRVMSYAVNGDLVNGLPFSLKSYCKASSNQKDIELGLRLSCDMKGQYQALKLTVTVPVTKSTISISKQLGGPGQSAELLLDKQELEWKISKILPRSNKTAQFTLIDGLKAGDTSIQEIGPVTLDFEISGYLSSNINIQQLKVLDSSQFSSTRKFVRYITVPETYVFHLQS